MAQFYQVLVYKFKKCDKCPVKCDEFVIIKFYSKKSSFSV